jgi:hypothetical protein
MKTRIMKLAILVASFFVSTTLLGQDFEVSPVKLDFSAEPGQSQAIPINIFNHSSQKLTFTIQLSDFAINKEGAKINMPIASTEHSLANWMSVNPPLVEVNPNEIKQVIISIQAPAGDFSTRWANIFITNTQEQTASLADKILKTGIQVQGQILVRARQSPKSNINYKMKISSLQAQQNQTDSLVYTANVENLGDKITSCKVYLMASNLSDAKETKLSEVILESYPDTQVKISLPMKKNVLPKGKYALAAILDYGNKANLEGTQIIIDVE